MQDEESDGEDFCRNDDDNHEIVLFKIKYGNEVKKSQANKKKPGLFNKEEIFNGWAEKDAVKGFGKEENKQAQKYAMQTCESNAQE